MCWLTGFWVFVLKAISCPKKKVVIIFGALNHALGGLVLPFWNRPTNIDASYSDKTLRLG